MYIFGRNRDLWREFLAFCGERDPCPELMLEFVRGLSSSPESDNEILRARAFSALAVLRTRFASYRFAQQRADAPEIPHAIGGCARARSAFV